MPTMKAAIVKQFGKPLVIEDVPVPQPGPGVTKVPLAEINDVFERMKAGKIDGRMVLDFG